MSKLKPVIREYAYIPIALLNEKLDALKSKFTFFPRAFVDRQVEPLILYDARYIDKGYIGLPIDWALEHYSHLDWQDKTTKGSGVRINAPRKINPNHPNAPAGQEQFINNMIKALEENYNCFAKAQTGTGKTESSLAVAAHFNVRTLVVVDRLDLAKQWAKRITDRLGLPQRKVAIISGKGSENMTASICVGVVHSLADNKYSKKFYNSFGMAIFDEVHTMGAKNFSKLFPLLRCTYNIGLTATDKRLDGAEFVYYSWLGKPKVTSVAKNLPLTVYRVEYRSRPLYSNTRALLLNQISKDKTRNRMIRDIVVSKYKEDRNILIISDRIEQLQELQQLCIDMGIPKKYTCLYVGEYKKNGRKVKVKTADREEMRKKSRVFFATYGLAEKGMDVPRLDTGIDATPRSQAEQTVGRVTRLCEGKKEAEWYTIYDSHVRSFIGNYYSRLKEYNRLKAKVKNYAR